VHSLKTDTQFYSDMQDLDEDEDDNKFFDAKASHS